MKKKYFLILALVSTLIAAAVLCAVFLLPGEEAPESPTDNYSTVATNYALVKEKIGKNEILLQESVTKKDGGDVLVTYRIYTVAEGYSASYFMNMTVEEAEQNPGLTLVGSAKASFLNGALSGLYGLTVSHDR